jgi:hypothetical protein
MGQGGQMTLTKTFD